MAAFLGNTLNVNAQDDKPLEYKALRTNTWSVYAQGGVSWATGLKFKSVNPAAGTSMAPEVGVGVNYNLRPWIRFGLNYEFSKYKREQRLENFEAVKTSFDGTASGITQNTVNNGGIAYRNLWNMYHNVDLTAEFNIMELWPNRSCNRFNLYAGTGIGMMFARGNTYTIGMGNEQWIDPNNATGNVGNWASYTWVKAENSRHNYNSVYVPMVLSAEYDVMPRLTLGVKGQYKALLSSDDFAPDGLAAAAVVVRYNFVGAKKGACAGDKLYKETLDKCNELRAEVARTREVEAESRKALDAANAENEQLKQQLRDCTKAVADCESKKTEGKGLTILFENNSSKLSDADIERLNKFAGALKADEQVTINIVGEASSEGNAAKNQVLSEKRLANVVSILAGNGVDGARIQSAKAIGDASNVSGPSHRKVEITVSR